MSARVLELRDAYRTGRLVVAASGAVRAHRRRRRGLTVISPAAVAELMLATPGTLTDGPRGRLVSRLAT